MNPTILIVFFISVLLAVGQPSYSELTVPILPVAQYDIAELMMQKYQLKVDQQEFTVFYRLSTLKAIGEGTSEDYDGKVVSIEINHERNSLIVNLDNIKQDDLMSLRFPQELISAEKGKFTLLVDGKKMGYEWSVQEDSRNLIFIIPEHTTKVEIIGTRVIPEFTSSVLVFSLITSILLVAQRLYKNSKTN
jgi:hypothetical protein